MHFHVMFASDKGYICHLGTCIHSLIKNNDKDFSEITLHIFEDGFQSEDKKKIIETCRNSAEQAAIEVIFYSNRELSFLTKNSYDKDYSLSIFSRLFASSALPPCLDRVLYLDCDAVVTGSFKAIYTLPFHDYYAGAVLGEFISRKHKSAVGLSESDPYFNSGLLLINLEKWRENHLEEQFTALIDDKKTHFLYPDQDIINIVLKDKIMILPAEYNLKPGAFLFRYKNLKVNVDLETYYSRQELKAAQEAPVFIHYTGSPYQRPWIESCTHPLRNEYLKYKSQTCWAGVPLEKDLRTSKNKMKDKLLKWMFGSCPYPVLKYILALRGHV